MPMRIVCVGLVYINTCLLLALYIRMNGWKQCLSLVVLFRAQRVCPWVCALCVWMISLTLPPFPPPLCEWERGHWLPLLGSITMPARGGRLGLERSENIQSTFTFEGLFSSAANPCPYFAPAFLLSPHQSTILLIPLRRPLFDSSLSSRLPSNVSRCALCKDTSTSLPSSFTASLSLSDRSG